MAIPAWAVSQCDGGHGVEAGCGRLLLPSAAERFHLFWRSSSRYAGIALVVMARVWQNGTLQAVQFSSVISPVRNQWICGSERMPWFRGPEHSHSDAQL